MKKNSEQTKKQSGTTAAPKSDNGKAQNTDLNYSSKHTEESTGLTPEENRNPDSERDQDE